MSESPQQSALDARNAAFWDELCGSALAKSIGLTDKGPQSLRKFDETYLGIYPYLTGYVDREKVSGEKVLEIGLGYGTLGQVIASRGAVYHGLDIAEGPVRMTRSRLELLGVDPADRVKQGSALEIPFANETFKFVYSIGCLHHTGDIPRSVEEVRRVLVPGGKAIVMLYNANSFRRRVEMPLNELRRRLREGRNAEREAERARARYDASVKGEAAPHVEFVSKRDVRRRIFAKFTDMRIDAQNFDPLAFRGRILVERASLLNNVARLAGLDLYIVATR